MVSVFLRRECFRRDDEQRCLGIECLQRLGDVGAVDIRDEMSIQTLLRVGLERLGNHDGAEIGAANADVNEIGDRLAGVAGPGAGADLVGKLLHVVEGRH